uniref:Secreted protein n=1 Tax=Haemonchus contortus TaxID=6289 RepID=A0A7I4Z5D0_HAECO|nr:unnamed protein product [Haemonchus contortus]
MHRDLFLALLAFICVFAYRPFDGARYGHDGTYEELWHSDLNTRGRNQKRWANQVRFGKRASSWASSIRFG